MSKWVDDKKGLYSLFFKNLEVMKETHLKKNQDYAGDGGTYFNFEYAAVIAKEFKDPVDAVFATMIGIKLARLAVLKRSGKKPNFESILDTHKDLTTYSAIWWAHQCEQEAKCVNRRRLRTRLRKRVSKASGSRRSTSKTRTSTAKAARGTDGEDTYRATKVVRNLKRRTV